MKLEILILLGGALHFLILIASAQAPRLLGWKEHLASLPEQLRLLFWVYGGFIVLTIVGFGVLSALFFEEIAAGSPLARGFAAFVALFWAARLGVQFWIFDAKAMLTRPIHRFGYHLLTILFVLIVLIYASAALQLEPFG